MGDNMEKEFYTYEELTEDMKTLAEKLRPYDFQMIIPVTRGGLVPACHLAYILNVKRIENICLSSYDAYKQKEVEVISVPKIPDEIPREKILVVDSMVDNGVTLNRVKDLLGEDINFLTIHVKPHTIRKPEFFLRVTSKWVVYPWDYEE